MEKLIRKVLKEYVETEIDELKRSQSVKDGYDGLFERKMDEVLRLKIQPESFMGMDMYENDEELLMVYKDEPCGYFSLNIFNDEATVDMTVVRTKFRGKGFGMIMYKYLIQKYKKLVTCGNQSPEARKAWYRLKKEGFIVLAKNAFEKEPFQTTFDDENGEVVVQGKNIYELSPSGGRNNWCLWVTK